MSSLKSHWIIAGVVLGVGLAVAVLRAWISTPNDRARAAPFIPAMTAKYEPNPRDEPASNSEERKTAVRADPLPSLPSAPSIMAAEPTLMKELRDVARSDPARAIELAREGNRRFPDSFDAPERASILIHALAATDRPSEARGEAEGMVNRYPDSDWVREIELFTGAHRHRNVEVGLDGRLQYR